MGVNLSWTCATTGIALDALPSSGVDDPLLSMVGRRLVNVINLCRA